jgi:hypothetical protein
MRTMMNLIERNQVNRMYFIRVKIDIVTYDIHSRFDTCGNYANMFLNWGVHLVSKNGILGLSRIHVKHDFSNFCTEIKRVSYYDHCDQYFVDLAIMFMFIVHKFKV